MSKSGDLEPSGPRRVVVIGTGGTIAMHGAHPYDWIDYADTGIINDIPAILALGELRLDGIETVAVPFRRLGSTGITPRDWQDLATTIKRIVASDPTIAGIVVTHGTASLEETAFFLSLVISQPQPVVLVGAQRPPNTSGSDALPNLRAAVATAASGADWGTGVLVVMDSEVHSARDVVKAANHQLDAFTSPTFGPLGRVDADASVVAMRKAPARVAVMLGVDDIAATQLPRVDISYSYAGADGTAIAAFLAAGACGIVSAAFPPGRCADGEREALLRAASGGVIVVQASRALRGHVPVQRYNSAVGILAGGRLSPQKVRIVVMLGLAAGLGSERIQQLLLDL